jgi:hypothetical protein
MEIDMATSKAKSATTQTSTTPIADAIREQGFASVQDAGFQQAGAYQTTESVAKYVMEQDATFPTEVSSEIKDALYGGYKMKFTQLLEPTVYAVINDHYVIATEEHMNTANIEKIRIGVDHAYSYSQQEFGKLKNTRPALHSLIGKVRDKTSTYCSNRLAELKRVAIRLQKDATGEESSTRKANKNFEEFVDDWFKDTAEDRLKTAKSRGDATADAKRFTNAKIAFMTKWRHADAK